MQIHGYLPCDDYHVEGGVLTMSCLIKYLKHLRCGAKLLSTIIHNHVLCLFTSQQNLYLDCFSEQMRNIFIAKQLPLAACQMCQNRELFFL